MTDKVTEEQIVESLLGTGGLLSRVISNIKKKYGIDCSRQLIEYRVSKSSVLQEIFTNERENIDDLGESAFLDAVERGEEWAVKEWLRYRGRHRGYQMTVAAKVDVATTIDANITQTVKSESIIDINLNAEDIKGKDPEKLKKLKEAILSIQDTPKSEGEPVVEIIEADEIRPSNKANR